MRSIGLASFEQVANQSKCIHTVSNPAGIRHLRISRALPPGKNMDEQVARLEDFFDASWEIRSPPDEIDQGAEEPVQSGSNQLVQVQRFKDTGVHQVNEYARVEAMKLRSIVEKMVDGPSKEGEELRDPVKQEETVPVEDNVMVQPVGLVEKLRKDVVELSSTTADTVSKKTTSIVSLGKHQAVTVQAYAKEFSKQYPLLYDIVYVGLGLTASLWLADRVGNVIQKTFKSKGEIEKQKNLRRKKGQRQRKRFQNMLGSFDQGVDTSVFNAVRQIGESAATYDDVDLEDDEDIVDRETMTKEMKAAWNNFVKDSRLSEGEFWTQDNIDQGLDEIEIEFEHDEDSIHDSVDIDSHGSVDIDD